MAACWAFGFSSLYLFVKKISFCAKTLKLSVPANCATFTDSEKVRESKITVVRSVALDLRTRTVTVKPASHKRLIISASFNFKAFHMPRYHANTKPWPPAMCKPSLKHVCSNILGSTTKAGRATGKNNLVGASGVTPPRPEAFWLNWRL